MKKIFLTLLLSICFTANAHAAEKIRVVTTTTTLASLAEELLGSSVQADVYAIASPKRDLHHVAPTPKDILKLKKADIFIHHGAQAEPWRLPLLNAAGRSDFFQVDGASIDAAEGISLLEVPKVLTRAEGDLHSAGNPHYWLDPLNTKKVMENILEKMVVHFPQLENEFRQNASQFNQKIDEHFSDWKRRLKPYWGEPFVSYHRSWSYFAKSFGFELVGEIEPKPGIPPTGRHLAALIKTIKQKGVKVILKETYFEKRTAKKLSKETGAQVAEMLQFVRGKKKVDTYFKMMDYNVSELERAFQNS